MNQKESQLKINLKTGARNILLGRRRNMKWRLPPVSQIDEGVGSAPRIAFLHFGLGGDFWKAGGDISVYIKYC